MVGGTALLLRAQIRMEGLALQTMTVSNMAVHTPGVKEMQMVIGTTAARY